ncbi:MAG: 3-isopropylmalate dehydrogenase [Pseudonocardia sp.]|uniref:3-isopropylmalate dehydrogenase n=1 Tax=unclassified Pseudonocardia TaxID=2619320 RepID=UPI00086F660B|nr:MULTISPECIES: 3-isopropylmalate dehydrogenase [unclassified Pseudonocardia]MBN9113412.1 3-isopropylmalate dehydrogenase [Pseudonocardia sp.]ODU23578.1 MAG: 3-isopropylmalate dehydrogenase [Pseudonocardia sp. SCN 72-51]ODV03714.1 MAG: 3-isopropylmalate dehydrogenase [Pseudonocardia sp. SCN 73-27]
MRTHNVAVIGGDGIGPDVTAAAVAAMRAAADRFGFTLSTNDFDLGAARYRRTGVALDDSTVEQLRGHDAILLGAIGDPDVAPGILERGVVLALRVALAQSVNIRPVRLYPGVQSPVRGITPQRCDMVILRENTEGLYAGGGALVHEGGDNAVALQQSVTTAGATRSIVDVAFRLAAARRGRLALCHKSNVLTYAGRLWDEVVEQVGAQYPDVERDYVHVDAMCQHLPLSPERFDVVVTDNLFGDIISDLGATVQGGLGLAASANLNPTGSAPSMFEPVHGSAPDIAGKGWANPAAAVLSAALCLASLGERDAALACEAAAANVVAELPALSGAAMGASTAEVGERIAARVATADPVTIGDPATSLMSAMAAITPAAA